MKKIETCDECGAILDGPRVSDTDGGVWCSVSCSLGLEPGDLDDID
jgi:hypothetical protein